MSVPLTVPMTSVPMLELPPSTNVIPTLLVLVSKLAPKTPELALAKLAFVPKEIEVEDTVPTIPAPVLEVPRPITTLLLLESNVALTCVAEFESATTAVPKEIDVEDTVPTMAVG